METTKKRYLLIDGIRGITIISMVSFHFCYDMFIVFGKNPQWYSNTGVHIWQQSICWTFIFISGFVWQWGKKANLKRGLLLNAFGFLITLVTFFAVPSETVWFGVLNFIGCAVLFMILLDKVLKNVPALLGFIFSFFLFLLFKNVNSGYLGFGELSLLQVPDWLYDIKVLTPLGFPFAGFASSDYFSILPWMFLYLCGYFFGRIFEKHETWQQIAQIKIPVLSVVGQKSIWIYLIHQPVCMLVSFVLFH